MGWTTAEVTKYIKTRLGFPLRAVELDKWNFEEAIQRALRQVTTWKPVFKLQSFTIAEGQQKYNLATPNQPNVGDNLDGLSLPYGKGLTRLFDSPIVQPQAVFSEFEYYRLRQPPYVDMGELLIDNMYYKEIGLLTGTHFDWEWVPDHTSIMITPRPTRTRPAVYEYNAEVSSIDELPGADQGWVADYALALAKEMLGRVRGKFQGVPGTELGLNLDWAELLQEGLEAQANLLEALQEKSRAAWTPPIKG